MTRTRLALLVGGGAVLLVVLGGLYLFNQKFTGPGLASRTTSYQVGEVIQGELVEHSFVLSNDGVSDVVITEVIPWASTVVSVDSVLPAGGEGMVKVAMNTAGLKGPLNELIKVRFAGESRMPIWLQLRGHIVLPVQIAPRDVVYFFTVAGEAPREELEIINHQDRSLGILEVSSTNPAFQVQSETVRRGRRYKLLVSLDPSIPPGEHESLITVKTDSPDYPLLEVKGWARVKDLVSTSISQLDFSTFPIASLELPAVSRRTVLVEKHKGTDFQVLDATVNIPFLDVQIEAQQPGQSYLVHVTIVESRAAKGEFAGKLVIETNDPEHARFELPISGNIL